MYLNLEKFLSLIKSAKLTNFLIKNNHVKKINQIKLFNIYSKKIIYLYIIDKIFFIFYYYFSISNLFSDAIKSIFSILLAY